MKILGIDPGYDRLGIAIIEKNDGVERLLHSECIETLKNSPLPERLFMAGNACQKLIETYQPAGIAIETIFFNKNIKTAIGVAQMRGIIIYLATLAGCEVYEYGPQEIKIAVTGYGNSDKTAVIMMVKQLLKNVPEKALDDEYDAIAVALTGLASIRR